MPARGYRPETTPLAWYTLCHIRPSFGCGLLMCSCWSTGGGVLGVPRRVHLHGAAQLPLQVSKAGAWRLPCQVAAALGREQVCRSPYLTTNLTQGSLCSRG